MTPSHYKNSFPLYPQPSVLCFPVGFYRACDYSSVARLRDVFEIRLMRLIVSTEVSL